GSELKLRCFFYNIQIRHNKGRAAPPARRAPGGARAGAQNTPAPGSTATADGRRAVHSFRTPKIRKDAATSQFTRGGFRKYGFPPTSGTMKLPVFSIPTAGRMRRPSSPLIAIEPSAGK